MAAHVQIRPNQSKPAGNQSGEIFYFRQDAHTGSQNMLKQHNGAARDPADSKSFIIYAIFHVYLYAQAPGGNHTPAHTHCIHGFKMCTFD